MTTLVVGLPADTSHEHATILKQHLAQRLGCEVVVITGATSLALVQT